MKRLISARWVRQGACNKLCITKSNNAGTLLESLLSTLEWRYCSAVAEPFRGCLRAAVTLMSWCRHDLAATLSKTAGEAASKTGNEVAARLKRACRRGVIQDCSVKDWRSYVALSKTKAPPSAQTD